MRNLKDNGLIYSLVCILLLAVAGTVYAGDESVLFTNVAPDALIVLDLSGSMAWPPAGQFMYIRDSDTCGYDVAYYSRSRSGYSKRCDISDDIPVYSSESCAALDTNGNAVPFYQTVRTGYNVDCSKVAIARRALFQVMDANNDNVVKGTGTNMDFSTLNVRMGYMRYYNSSNAMPTGMGITTTYSKLMCNSTTSCSSDTCSANSNYICGARASGGTPAIQALADAKTYLDTHKASDPAGLCRNKFAILITDGQDTLGCSGDGGDWQDDQYKRRRGLVAKAKALNDAGYSTFVVGFGDSMPFYLRNTLNWAAFYGGTDNPNESNSGSTTAFNPAVGGSCENASTVCYKHTCLAGVGLTCPTPTYTTCTAGTDDCLCLATSNDPGGSVVSGASTLTVNNGLSGYAFIATSADDLSSSLRHAFDIIRQAYYSFTVTSVSSARIISENQMYEASFEPVDADPFWRGHLKKYQIADNGTVGASLWDAGVVLRSISSNSRNIKTYKSGSFTDFTVSNITPTDLGFASGDTTSRNNVVEYFRGNPSFNDDDWPLGDIFHSSPVVITSPSPFFKDAFDHNHAYESYRTSHQRTSASTTGGRVVLGGANDGQLHIFRTYDGLETFSFIPPNLLPKLKNIQHLHPEGVEGSSLPHRLFVDGPISAADVWLGTGNGTAKSASDWHTVAIISEGRGADVTTSVTEKYLWSSSSSCDSGFSNFYDVSHPNYCGYYALDLTDPLNPSYLWRVNPPASSAPYLGEPWSRMAIGRVKIGTEELWVGFIGGGGFQYNPDPGPPIACPITPTPPDALGKMGQGFFVVELKTGNVIWNYTSFDNSAMKSIFAAPAIVDTDGDGFIDTVYVGDLGGNIWRFKPCTSAQISAGTCTSASSAWSGGRLYMPSSSAYIRPVYSAASVVKDTNGTLWVYWGTGDKQCVNATNGYDQLYALKDPDRSSTHQTSAMDNFTSCGSACTLSHDGWYVKLNGSGEKMLADTVVFGGFAFFATYTPSSGSDPCQTGGNGTLYGLNYLTAAGAFSGDTRTKALGTGVPTTPVISLNPVTGKPDMYISVSGGGGVDTPGAFRVDYNPVYPTNPSKLLYWKDLRIK